MAQSIFFDVVARDRASSTFSRIAKSTDATEKRLKNFGRTARTLAGIGSALAVGGGLISFLKDTNTEAREAQKVGALTNQVIASTGGVAKVSAGHVEALATSISNKVGIDDEAIQSGSNLLLTFKNIRNEVGAGNKVFDRATAAAVNLSAAGFGSISSSSKMVGKALNDPLKGIAALSRAGVTFTQKQKDQIKALVETGDTLKAQKIILKEIESQVGGAAEAQVTAGDKARVAWKNLEEQIGTALLPQIDKLATVTADKVVPAVSKFITEMETGKGVGGDVADVIGDLADAGERVVSVFNAIPGPIKKTGAELLIAGYAMKRLSFLTGGLGTSFASPIARTKQFAAEMTYAETRMAAVTSASQRFGGAIRQLAGAGGMVLLADGASKAGSKLGVLESAAGGALSGAALGAFAGPQGALIGSAIGGLGGAAMALMHKTEDAGGAARSSLSHWRDYASTLDSVTGATTAATRAMVIQKLQSSKVLESTRAAGLADRQVVNAVVNGGKARDRVVAALKAEKAALDANVRSKQAELGANLKAAQDYSRQSVDRKKSFDAAMATKKELDALKDLRDERSKDISATLKSLGAVDKSIQAKRNEIAATRTFSKAINALPPRVKTLVTTEGLKPGIAGVVELARKMKLTPDQIRILIRENGGKGTDAQIKRVQDRARALGKMSPTVNVDANTSRANAKLDALLGKLARVSRGVLNLSSQSLAGPKKGGRSADPLGTGASSGRMLSSQGRTAGGNYATGIIAGITGKKMKVSRAMEALGNIASTVQSRLNDLISKRAQFQSTFTADSIFGADSETSGKSLGSLLNFSENEKQKALQLQQDVQRVIGMGLSKGLLAQLQGQGTAGANTLHLLAQGSASQVAAFNANNAATSAALQAAGMTVGNAVNGGSINAQIAQAQRDEALAKSIARELAKFDSETVIYIDSDAIIRAVKKRNKRKGQKTAGM